MKTVFLALAILLGGILAAAAVGILVRGESQDAVAPQKPITPLVYCHAQGGEVVDGKCVPHNRKPQ